MDLFKLMGLAKNHTKFGIMAKDAFPTVVVNVNLVEDAGRFIAILSDEMVGSNIIGVDVTDGIDGFNEAISSTGYKWSEIYTGPVPDMLPLVVLRAEQDFADSSEEYHNRLLLVRI